jgi:hypothetical protein
MCIAGGPEIPPSPDLKIGDPPKNGGPCHAGGLPPSQKSTLCTCMTILREIIKFFCSTYLVKVITHFLLRPHQIHLEQIHPSGSGEAGQDVQREDGSSVSAWP